MSGRLAPWVTLALSLAGIAVSAYLTWVHYEEDALVCGLGDCTLVQNSEYATLMGVPIAILGLLMYLAILGLAALRLLRPVFADRATAAIFGVSLAGLLYSLYLTYVEIWVIEAICQWCVVSAIITALIFAVETARLWESGDPETG